MVDTLQDPPRNAYGHQARGSSTETAEKYGLSLGSLQRRTSHRVSGAEVEGEQAPYSPKSTWGVGEFFAAPPPTPHDPHERPSRGLHRKSDSTSEDVESFRRCKHRTKDKLKLSSVGAGEGRLYCCIYPPDSARHSQKKKTKKTTTARGVRRSPEEAISRRVPLLSYLESSRGGLPPRTQQARASPTVDNVIVVGVVVGVF